MPAARTFTALAVATLLAAVSAVQPRLAVAAAVADVLILVALFVDHRRAAGAVLSAEREWPAILVQGAPAEVRVRLRTPATRRALTVVAREGLHPGLAPAPLRARLLVAPGADCAWTYRLSPRLRGEHAVGPLTVRVLGPWGLAWSQRDLVPPERRRVYPQVRWEGTVGRLLTLAHRRELGRDPARRAGLGTEPYALRLYRPGDPPNRIHWKATARHGRTISREETWDQGRRLMVLLDCARAMASRDGARSKLDHALASALALTRVAISRGDRVTLIAFSDRVERVVRARGGTRAVSRVYDALYDVEARLSEPAYDLAAEAASTAETRRSLVVLFTSVVDLAAAEGLRQALLRLRRHRTLLVNLEDPELRQLALGRPGSPEEAFAKVSSLEILVANRRLARQLRRAGIRAVSASADQLALKALDAYLALLDIHPRGAAATGAILSA
jgi:uncharacterized protein (DUF58 family)